METRANYKVKGAAEILDVSDRTIFRWINDGRLPYVDLSGGRGKRRIIRFRAEDLKAFVEENRKSIEG